MGKTYKQEAARIKYGHRGKANTKKVKQKLEFMDSYLNNAGIRQGNDRKTYAKMKVADRRLSRKRANQETLNEFFRNR